MLAASGYDTALLSLPDGRRRLANVRKLMRLAREWEAEAGPDLAGFVEAVGRRREADPTARARRRWRAKASMRSG